MSPTRTTPPTENDHAPEPEAGILIGRIIDREDSRDDRRQFDRLAETEPALWRELALCHRDAVDLGDEFRRATASAMATELPRSWLVPRRLSWTAALSGWAAVIIVAASWMLVTLTDPSQGRPETAAPVVVPLAPDLTYEEHFHSYLDAPYVLGEMQPVVLDVETFPDGGTGVRFLRRIEEIMYLDPDEELPVDETGEMQERVAPKRPPAPGGRQN